MRLFPIFLLSFFLISSIMIVQGGDVDTINAGLQANKGAVYTVPAGVHTITSMFTLPEGTTLQGTVGPNGELLTTLKNR